MGSEPPQGTKGHGVPLRDPLPASRIRHKKGFLRFFSFQRKPYIFAFRRNECFCISGQGHDALVGVVGVKPPRSEWGYGGETPRSYIDILFLLCGDELLCTAHVLPQHLGDIHRAICLQVILQEGNQHTRGCGNGIIECIGEVFLPLCILHANP